MICYSYVRALEQGMNMRLTDRQREMLRELDAQGRFYDYIDLRTFNALHAKGLVTTYTPPGCSGMDTKCYTTPEGRAALAQS